MSDDETSGHNRPWVRIALILVTLFLAIAVQSSMIVNELTEYSQAYLSLYYLPMILASYYMPKYGPFQAFLIGSIPLMVSYSLYNPGYRYAIILLIWLILFVFVGWMISLLVIKSKQTMLSLEETSKELQDSKDLLNIALWGAGLGVWEQNVNDGNTHADQRWRSLMGYRPEEYLPNDVFFTHIHPEFKQQYLDTESDLKHGRLENAKLELKLYRKGGEEIWGRVYMTVKHDKNGNISAIVGILQDITGSIAQQMEVMSANEKLNILSSISRDDILKEISTLQGYLGLLDLDGYILPDTNSWDYLKKANESIDKIIRQLEFTRQYQDIGSKTPEWHNIPEKVKKMAARPEFSSLDVTVDCPVEVLADPLFMNVFYNLFENTVQHGGNAKKVKIEFGHGQNEGVIVYQDDGKGIPNSMKSKIFDRGYGDGTGYGLFISKEILELTDMKIREVGVEGKGARFEITVPLANLRWLNDKKN
ncbi:MAG: hypothetical protein PWQ88_884 [Candidatus Methanomethylophilaceae archaeon]|nr:hypothetical protein [Candidatus Methanomethylophilaceae archaeon]MDI3541988.1 hypothetical protein [Candidatus Methanomethylophilaceae archaeon]HIJ00360.1 PAS domain-containing protein [Candidatus Methanomethylophilaceae archaeon]